MLARNYVSTSKSKIAYAELGSPANPPLVMLHGMMGFADYFIEIAQYMSSHFWVIVPDLPGFGYSSETNDNNFDTAVNAIIDFLSALGIRRASFFGISLGGTLSLQIALRKPSLVSKLIVLSPIINVNKIQFKPLEYVEIFLSKLPDYVIAHFQKPSISKRLFDLALFLDPSLNSLPGMYKDLVLKALQLLNWKSSKQLWHSIESYKILKIPQNGVLFISGMNDELIPVAETIKHAVSHRKAVVIINDADHKAVAQKPRVISKIILNYIQNSSYYTNHDTHWIL